MEEDFKCLSEFVDVLRKIHERVINDGIDIVGISKRYDQAKQENSEMYQEFLKAFPSQETVLKYFGEPKDVN
jgi:hypothetical protein